jgi:hypothetical protein
MPDRIAWSEVTREHVVRAILGTADEPATGHPLASTDFGGGKSGAVKVLGKLGFTVHQIQKR